MILMRIRWTKADGFGKPDTLACFRDDGTSSYARLSAYFPLHDLLHYAVESTLEFSDAFWGLIWRGWDLEDFAVKDSATGKLARSLPQEARFAEHLVGYLQLVESGALTDEPEEFTTYVRSQWPVLPREVTPESVVRIRSQFARLKKRWEQLPAGGALELEFPPSPGESES